MKDRLIRIFALLAAVLLTFFSVPAVSARGLEVVGGTGGLEVIGADENYDNYENYYYDGHNSDGLLVSPYEASTEPPQTYTLPGWWKDESTYVRTHNEAAPRVVDNANIFSDAEEAQMLETIRRIQEEDGVDLVVFTDVTSAGQTHGRYAEAFYYFNGYGLGDRFSGSILFICMEEGNRGWWTAATGSVESLYTSSVINSLNDSIESYLKAGAYGRGAVNYVQSVYDLYESLKPPAWYPSDPANFARYQDASKDRVVDLAGSFSASQKAALTEKINKIRNTYGYDVLLLTDRSTPANWGLTEYGEKYYYYNGYGEGAAYNGAVLTLKANGGYLNSYSLSFLDNKLGGENASLNAAYMREWLEEEYYQGNTYDLSMAYLERLEKSLKKGRVAKRFHYETPALLGGIGGALAGLLSVGSKKRGMQTIEVAKTAENYLVPGSFKLSKNRDLFLYANVTRVPLQPEIRNDGPGNGGGGGGHTYSGSHQSFGGTTFTGGGGKF